MIKLTFCLRRRAELTLEAFQDYWLNQHAPLVRQHAEALNIRRYVQTHRTETELNDAIRQGRGAPEPYDGVAELWWDSLEDLESAMSGETGQAAGLALLEDEQKFIDLANSPLWLNREQVIVGD